MSNPLEIRIDCGAIHVNGKLVAEVAIDQVATRDDLLDQVRSARGLRSLARFVCSLPDELRKIPDIADHVNTTKAARQQAYVRGLMDGLEQKTVPYPTGDDIPPIRPEQTRAYSAGYQTGEAMARAVKLALQGSRSVP